MMMKTFSAAIVAAVALAGTAGAATMTGLFDVSVVQATNATSSESKATDTNFFNAISASHNTFDTFSYDGALDFGTYDTANDATTILQWLNSGGGTVSGLDATIGGLQLSKPDINANPGTATSTFFLFIMRGLGAADFLVDHDDGMAIFDVSRIGGFDGPNTQRTTKVTGFDGGLFQVLYVATNGDPSVLKVDMTPVPVPASLPLLLAGVGGFAFLRRRTRR